MDSVLFGRIVDAPLNEQGTREAQMLADRLAPLLEHPVIEASPRRRTRETAAAIAARCDCKVRTCAELDEIDFGRWSSRSFRELDGDSAWRLWNEDRANARTPAGETIAGVQQRALGRLLALATEFGSRTIVVVTHSEIIRSLVLFSLGASPNRFDSLAIDPISITKLSVDGDRIRVQSVNERFLS